MEEKIRPLTLEINKELWNKFKEKTPRTVKLNDAVVQLIKKEVNQNGKRDTANN